MSLRCHRDLLQRVNEFFILILFLNNYLVHFIQNKIINVEGIKLTEVDCLFCGRKFKVLLIDRDHFCSAHCKFNKEQNQKPFKINPYKAIIAVGFNPQRPFLYLKSASIVPV